jgi:hypothetical protein
MTIRNGGTVAWYGCLYAPSPDNWQQIELSPTGAWSGTVIDADPNATMVSVQVDGEPFFRRIPAWMLQPID